MTIFLNSLKRYKQNLIPNLIKRVLNFFSFFSKNIYNNAFIDLEYFSFQFIRIYSSGFDLKRNFVHFPSNFCPPPPISTYGTSNLYGGSRHLALIGTYSHFLGYISGSIHKVQRGSRLVIGEAGFEAAGSHSLLPTLKNPAPGTWRPVKNQFGWGQWWIPR